MDGEDDFDAGDTDIAEHEPAEGNDSRSDVEEALISQRADKGHPDPRDERTRRPLRGRNDTAPGGRYEGLEEFAQIARKNNTTIQAAVKDYHEVETMLRKDFVGGVTQIAQRFGLDPRQVAAAMYQQHNGPQGNQYQQQQAAQYQQQILTRKIDAFRSDPSNKHFETVRHDMAQLVAEGKATTLQEAYKLAINNNPQLRVQAKMDRMYAREDADKAKYRKVGLR